MTPQLRPGKLPTMNIVLDTLNFELATSGRQGDSLVLMLHGFPQTNYSWRHQMAPLAAAGYFVAAPNQRGYSAGARPVGIDHYQTGNLIDDALGLIDRLGYTEAHIVGHDWGGQLAWLLAARHPDRVASLTVLSRPHPRAFLEAIEKDSQQANRSKHHRAFQDPDIARLLLENDAARLRALFGGQAVSPVDQDAYLEILGSHAALDAAINWYRAAARSSATVRPLGAGDTPAISADTLYIWGNEDATVGRIAAEGTAAWVSGGYRFEELDGVGHFITDEAGGRVTDVLLDHLARCPSG